MVKPPRPTLQPPANGGSMLDEITATTANRPPGRPPFAPPRNPDPTPPAAPPQVPAQAQPEDTDPETAAAAPARPAAARRPARPARARAARQSPAGIPEPPPGYIGTRKPMQVYVPGEDHWNLKYGALVRGTDMSKVVASLVSAFNHDPDAWATLIARAEDERVPLGEILSPYLAHAVEDAG